MNNTQLTIPKVTAISANKLFSFCLKVFLLLALALKKWMTTSIFITAIIGLYVFVKSFKNSATSISLNNAEKKWLLWITITLLSPLLAIFLGQAIRQEFNFSVYDSSVRFCLVIPVLYAIIYTKTDSFKYFEYTLPITLIFALISLAICPNEYFAKDGRFSTYFIDPLIFGSTSLTLALMSLISINLYKQDELLIKAFKFLGFMIGIFLSVLSGSRTGWAAIPLVLLLWVYVKLSGKYLFFSFIGLTIFITLLFFIPIVEQRVHIAANEIINYNWSALNADTSVGLRISFFRIGLFLFSHHLFSGWGNNFQEMLNHPELTRFASEYAREIVLKIGFHNEVMANMVKSGIWGLLSVMLVFLVPGSFFIKGLRSHSTVIRNYALMAMSYLICVFVSGLTNEVFSAKLSVSFHAMVMVNLLGSLFVMMSSNQQLEKI